MNRSAQPTTDREQFLFYTFITALEGGIGYWARTEQYHWTTEPGPDALDHEDVAGFYAVIVDAVHEEETGEQRRYRIDAATISKGINGLATATTTFGGAPLDAKAQQFYRKVNRANDAGLLDAGTADNVVQAGLFGDVVYG